MSEIQEEESLLAASAQAKQLFSKCGVCLCLLELLKQYLPLLRWCIYKSSKSWGARDNCHVDGSAVTDRVPSGRPLLRISTAAAVFKEVDGVLRITKIRLRYAGCLPADVTWED